MSALHIALAAKQDSRIVGLSLKSLSFKGPPHSEASVEAGTVQGFSPTNKFIARETGCGQAGCQTSSP